MPIFTFDLREDPMTIVFLLLADGAAGAGSALNESLVIQRYSEVCLALGAMLLVLVHRYG